MGCLGCNVGNGSPAGCGNNGNCSSGACNKLNTYNWLSEIQLPEDDDFAIVEVSFDKGSRKGFFRKPDGLAVDSGDLAVVEATHGYDLGRISLSGELVRLQMKKKEVVESEEIQKVIRRANDRDLDRFEKAKSKETDTMVRARAMARSLKLEMKIGKVEYQGDGKKATFYYIADDRVDFRELIKLFAKEFKVKIEMRQIGARQEAGKIGGVGSCGRELCCSTWLTQFKSVTTSAARYQQLSINQSKLSGQCGRLKCCLNYELDTYMEGLNEFPDNADNLLAEEGKAELLKIDIFKRLMYYSIESKSLYLKVPVERVKEVLDMNKQGKKPGKIVESKIGDSSINGEKDDLVGHISLQSLEKTSRKKKYRRNNRRNRRNKK